MHVARTFAVIAALVASTLAVAQHAPSAAPAAAGKDAAARGLSVANKPWTGDFDRMLERRMIRVYVPYSRSLYFNDKGRERGLSAELVRDFERWINKKYAAQLGKRPLTIYIVPATRDKLLPDVVDGLADIAMGNLTVTADRQKSVDFVSPTSVRTVNEVIVTGPASPPLAGLDDLGGKTVHVRRASSYYESRGAQLNVGDIKLIEPNIHGGAKYMDQLMVKYFPDAKFSQANRPLFAFASYNCGPGNVRKMRAEAAKRGLDPDKWFNNVEIVTAEKIGIETTTYVRNIYKYYVAYRLMLDAQGQLEQARLQVAPGKP